MKHHLIVLLSALLCGNAIAQSRFTDVEWIVKTKPNSVAFEVTMNLITAKGRKVSADPGFHYKRWNSFRFICSDLSAFEFGEGRIKMNRAILGKDTLVVTAISEVYGLHSSFKIPVDYCQGIRLVSTALDYGTVTPLEWRMLMNNGEELPVDERWLDLSLLENQSDHALRFDNNTCSLTGPPVAFTHVKLINKHTGKIVADEFLTVQYPSKGQLDFSGRKGRNGRSGTAGSQNGESGKSGENGENGEDAEAITVFVRPYKDPGLNLLEVIVISEKKRRQQFYVSNNDPHITVLANGGKGGNGGWGGNGAEGQVIGEREDERHWGAEGGNGGNGGYGGHGGNGADVLVIVQDDVPNPETVVEVKNEGGKSGSGGPSGNGGDGERANGLLTAFINTDGSTGNKGLGGSDGQPGIFRGVRTISAADFESELKRAGW